MSNLLDLYDRNRDAFYLTLSELDYIDLISLCKSNPRLNELICKGNDPGELWSKLWFRDFSVHPLPQGSNYRTEYINAMKELSKMSLDKAILRAAVLGYDVFIKKNLKRNIGGSYYNEIAHHALTFGHFDIFEHALNMGARGYSSLMALAAAKGYKDIVNQLLKLGARDYNNTARSAAYHGHREILEQMISLGALDYNYILDGAASGGQVDLVEFLLDLGADDYESAMYSALYGANVENGEAIREIINLLLERGAKLPSRTQLARRAKRDKVEKIYEGEFILDELHTERESKKKAARESSQRNLKKSLVKKR